MATLERAIEIATEAHRGQLDKAGNEYIGHPLRVMAMGKTTEEKIVGILHDVVEDSSWTFERLAAEGFSAPIIEALRCLTKQPDSEPYDKYIARIKHNPLAVAVKLNDLTDNMDIRRLPYLSDKDVKRLKKYLKAYKQLTGTPTYSVYACQQEYPNAYAPWSEEDDWELTRMWCEGASVKDLANHFQRKPGAIRSRIKKLELEKTYGTRE
jgi:(p)ppGpp synthase/HD superfamily hydrolase